MFEGGWGSRGVSREGRQGRGVQIRDVRHVQVRNENICARGEREECVEGGRVKAETCAREGREGSATES